MSATNLRSSSTGGRASKGSGFCAFARAAAKCSSGDNPNEIRGGSAALWLWAPACCPSACLLSSRPCRDAFCGTRGRSQSSSCLASHAGNSVKGGWFRRSSIHGKETDSNHWAGNSFRKAKTTASCDHGKGVIGCGIPVAPLAEEAKMTARLAPTRLAGPPACDTTGCWTGAVASKTNPARRSASHRDCQGSHTPVSSPVAEAIGSTKVSCKRSPHTDTPTHHRNSRTPVPPEPSIP